MMKGEKGEEGGGGRHGRAREGTQHHNSSTMIGVEVLNHFPSPQPFKVNGLPTSHTSAVSEESHFMFTALCSGVKALYAGEGRLSYICSIRRSPECVSSLTTAACNLCVCVCVCARACE